MAGTGAAGSAGATGVTGGGGGATWETAALSSAWTAWASGVGVSFSDPQCSQTQTVKGLLLVSSTLSVTILRQLRQAVG